MIARSFAVLLICAAPALAQQPPAPKFGCEDKPEVRQFDFWVGEWKVMVTGTENVAGRNSIQLINQSCALLENWTGGRGGTGKSINFYNAATRKWHQTWIDNQGGVTFFTGEYRDDAMRFEGERVGANGTTSPVRLTFTKIAADTVRQLGEGTSDGGQTWTVQYDLTYVRER
jgi:hypothetical protein